MEIENKSRGLMPPELYANSRGQAAVEYLLLVILAVILLFGLTANFFTPFKEFVSNSMGKYTECLLETGEVPRLGGDSNLQEDASTCGSLMGAKGKERRFGAGGAIAGNDENSGKDANISSSNSGSGGGSGRGAAVPRSTSGLIGRGRTGDGAGPSKTTQIPIKDLQGSGFFKASGRSVWDVPQQGSGKLLNVDIENLSASAKAQVKQDLRKKNENFDADESIRRKAKKIIVKPPERNIASDNSDEELHFSDYLRYFFIILVILVLLIVLGGQGYRLSKSWEK